MKSVLLPHSCGCQQDSTPCGYRIHGSLFFKASKGRKSESASKMVSYITEYKGESDVPSSLQYTVGKEQVIGYTPT